MRSYKIPEKITIRIKYRNKLTKQDMCLRNLKKTEYKGK